MSVFCACGQTQFTIGCNFITPCVLCHTIMSDFGAVLCTCSCVEPRDVSNVAKCSKCYAKCHRTCLPNQMALICAKCAPSTVLANNNHTVKTTPVKTTPIIDLDAADKSDEEGNFVIVEQTEQEYLDWAALTKQQQQQEQQQQLRTCNNSAASSVAVTPRLVTSLSPSPSLPLSSSSVSVSQVSSLSSPSFASKKRSVVSQQQPGYGVRGAANRVVGDVVSFNRSVLAVLGAVSEHYPPFATPVPRSIRAYHDFIKTPLDLERMCVRARNNAYVTLAHLRVDLDLIVANCVAFNGGGVAGRWPEYIPMAYAMRATVLSQVAAISGIGGLCDDEEETCVECEESVSESNKSEKRQRVEVSTRGDSAALDAALDANMALRDALKCIKAPVAADVLDADCAALAGMGIHTVEQARFLDDRDIDSLQQVVGPLVRSALRRVR